MRNPERSEGLRFDDEINLIVLALAGFLSHGYYGIPIGHEIQKLYNKKIPDVVHRESRTLHARPFVEHHTCRRRGDEDKAKQTLLIEIKRKQSADAILGDLCLIHATLQPALHRHEARLNSPPGLRSPGVHPGRECYEPAQPISLVDVRLERHELKVKRDARFINRTRLPSDFTRRWKRPTELQI